MATVTGVTNSLLPPSSSGGHDSHGPSLGTASAGNGGNSFASTLSQAISQSSGGAPHGSHAAVSTPGAPAQGGHIPLAGSAQGKKHSFQQMALGLRAYRQQIIASNIANADTPGYKAVDIDFQEAVRIAKAAANTPTLALATSALGHVPGQAIASTPPFPLKYHVPSQPSVDGNTVEIDVERAKFTDNSIMYQFSMDRVSGHFKMLMELYQNLK